MCKSIAIVYHSGFGHTQMLAQAIAAGVDSQKLHSHLLTTKEAMRSYDTLGNADAIIFGTPTYMGGVSAEMKIFMEDTNAAWLTQAWKDKIAAGFTNSGSMSGDKFNTLVQLCVFALQHSMIWIGPGEADESPDGNKGAPYAVNRMGSYLGVMAQSDNDMPANTPPEGDKKTAYLLGVRVATYVTRHLTIHS